VLGRSAEHDFGLTSDARVVPAGSAA
jgi:hypothetical protein